MCIVLVPSGESHGFCGIGGCAIGCSAAGAPMNFGTSRSVGSDGIGSPLIAGIGGRVTSGSGTCENAGAASAAGRQQAGRGSGEQGADTHPLTVTDWLHSG